MKDARAGIPVAGVDREDVGHAGQATPGPMRAYDRSDAEPSSVAGLPTIVAMALTPQYGPALLFFGGITATGMIFNIQTGSLRQIIVPDHLLGRVQTSGRVLAWSAIPLGSLAGGWAISATGNVGLIYALVGAAEIVIPLVFAGTALGHADRYLPVAPTAAAPARPSHPPHPRRCRQATWWKGGTSPRLPRRFGPLTSGFAPR